LQQFKIIDIVVTGCNNSKQLALLQLALQQQSETNSIIAKIRKKLIFSQARKEFSKLNYL